MRILALTLMVATLVDAGRKSRSRIKKSIRSSKGYCAIDAIRRMGQEERVQSRTRFRTGRAGTSLLRKPPTEKRSVRAARAERKRRMSKLNEEKTKYNDAFVVLKKGDLPGQHSSDSKSTINVPKFRTQKAYTLRQYATGRVKGKELQHDNEKIIFANLSGMRTPLKKRVRDVRDGFHLITSRSGTS